MLEAEVEHGFALGRREGILVPRTVGIVGKNVVDESDELPAAVMRHHLPDDIIQVVPVHVIPGRLHHFARDIDAEFQRF